MNTNTIAEPARVAEDRCRAIRKSFNKTGVPPTVRETARFSSHSPSLIEKEYQPATWDDILRSAGVPGRDDVVADAVRSLFAERYAWQSFVEFKAADIGDETGMDASGIGNTLAKIEDGRRAPDAMDGLTIARLGGGEKAATTWRVRARDGKVVVSQ